MCKFKQITLQNYKDLYYIPQIINCYCRYSKYLQDDFAPIDKMFYIYNTVPYLWAITDRNDDFKGFVSLDNFTGNEDIKFSAELSVCFDKKAWGSFPKYCAKIFLKKCFDELGLYKIKALIFPDNFRVKTLLKSSGFQYETTMPNETIRNAKLQDIEIYSLTRNYYYKDEVNYD